MQALRILLVVALIGTLCCSAQERVISDPPEHIAELRGSNMKLVIAQVAHRHGARSALVSANSSIICPAPGGCGILNEPGKDMLVQLGKYIRSRYQNITNSEWFKTESYDPEFTYTRSTDIMRTLQSADGLLHGLYPNNSAFYPAINTRNVMLDQLLIVGAQPSFKLWKEAEMNVTLRPKVYEYLKKKIDAADIVRMGLETSLVELCESTEPAPIARCVLELQDITEAWNALGTLAAKCPTCLKNHDALNDVRSFYNTLQFSYNQLVDVDVNRGSLGQNLAQQLMANMNSAINTINTPNKRFQDSRSPRFFEYSAHDTTMMPLCSTLGHNEAMRPPFGQMYLFDLLEDEATKEFYVRTQQGFPQQTPGDHEYAISNFSLHCMTEKGGMYIIDNIDGVCPIADWERWINYSKPLKPAGDCYVSAENQKAVDCYGLSKPAPNDLCKWFRAQCPQWACPSTHFVDFSDLSCQPILVPTPATPAPEKQPKKSITTGVLAAVIVCSVLGGMLLGIAGMRMFRLMRPSDSAAAVADGAYSNVS